MTVDKTELDQMYALIRSTNKEKPAESDISSLRALLKKPELLNDLGDFTQQNINHIVGGKNWRAAAREVTKAHMQLMANELHYDTAPQLEKLLIDAVMLSWLRYQTFETSYTQLEDQGMTLEKAAFWDKRITAAQGRYLRACEVLARVRKLISPVLQVNIAQDGGQQVNIAGDLVKS